MPGRPEFKPRKIELPKSKKVVTLGKAHGEMMKAVVDQVAGFHAATQGAKERNEEIGRAYRENQSGSRMQKLNDLALRHEEEAESHQKAVQNLMVHAINNALEANELGKDVYPKLRGQIRSFGELKEMVRKNSYVWGIRSVEDAHLGFENILLAIDKRGYIPTDTHKGYNK